MSDCVHYWVLDQRDEGFCKRCGEPYVRVAYHPSIRRRVNDGPINAHRETLWYKEWSDRHSLAKGIIWGF